MEKLKFIMGRNALKIALLISVLSLVAVFGLEYFAGFKPCILCWTQRVVVMLFILVGIVVLAIKPLKKASLVLSSTLLSLISISGIGFALRHIYIINQPPAESCSFGADMMFTMLPFQKALQEFIKGSPSCSNIEGILGVPFPYLSLIMFIVLLILSFSLLSLNKKIKYH